MSVYEKYRYHGISWKKPFIPSDISRLLCLQTLHVLGVPTTPMRAFPPAVLLPGALDAPLGLVPTDLSLTDSFKFGVKFISSGKPF